jgi:hypothetical protein
MKEGYVHIVAPHLSLCLPGTNRHLGMRCSGSYTISDCGIQAGGRDVLQEGRSCRME